MKKLLSILLAVTVIFTTMAISGYSTSAKTYKNENYAYKIKEDGTICITEYKGNEMEVVIPEKIDDKTVTEIDYVFVPNHKDYSYVENIRSVFIPKTVTEINLGNFNFLSLLKYVIVDKENPNYCSIGGVLFSKDKKTLFCYPSAKTGYYYKIPESVELISGGAFNGSKYLMEVKIGKKVKEIGGGAFLDCLLMQHIVIPKNVETIGRFALGCRWVEETSQVKSEKSKNAKRRNLGHAYYAPIEGFEVYARKGTAAYEYCKDRKNYASGYGNQYHKNIKFVKIPLKRPVIKKLTTSTHKGAHNITHYDLNVYGKSYDKPFTSYVRNDYYFHIKNRNGEAVSNESVENVNGMFIATMCMGTKKPKLKLKVRYRVVMRICGYELKSPWSKAKTIKFK